MGTPDTIASRVEQLTTTIKSHTSEAERTLTGLATSTTEVIGTRLEQLNLAIKSNAGEAERSLVQLATNTTNSIRTTAQDAERSLSGMS